MEVPKKMTSNIIETDTGITISTPKRKSWALIIFLSLITLQFTNALIQSLFFAYELSVLERISIFILSLIVVYFTLKGLLWQLKGVKEIYISSDELKLSKLSPLWTKTKTYNLSEVKNIDIKDETVSEGPTAMLQLLRITDKIKITFSYGYETITATSGIDQMEAIELKDIIKNKIGLLH
ncbi:hypothetical protein VB776_15205 [Arcicella sp. DC2W]|uniref:DUF304 domain-containing protein n=1 Tax=Arcicella gelida TaxID=2984195 RepID=A0ABU5S722_9BACT|nr:hypothetical protein [Arcicella sp. DC2W]MEA5404278.1 hypothetical protein [Arcicella sp. DC2W]